MSGPAESPADAPGSGTPSKDLFAPTRGKIASSHARGYAAGYVEGHAEGGMRKALEIVRNLLKLGAATDLVLAAAEIPAGWDDDPIWGTEPIFGNAVGELAGSQDGIYARGYALGCIRGLNVARAACEETRAKLLSLDEEDPLFEKKFTEILTPITRRTSDEGRAEIRAEGRAAGRADGIAEGGTKMAARIARTLLLRGAAVDFVVSAAGLPLAEVERLAAETR